MTSVQNTLPSASIADQSSRDREESLIYICAVSYPLISNMGAVSCRRNKTVFQILPSSNGESRSVTAECDFWQHSLNSCAAARGALGTDQRKMEIECPQQQGTWWPHLQPVVSSLKRSHQFLTLCDTDIITFCAKTSPGWEPLPWGSHDLTNSKRNARYTHSGTGWFELGLYVFLDRFPNTS